MQPQEQQPPPQQLRAGVFRDQGLLPPALASAHPGSLHGAQGSAQNRSHAQRMNCGRAAPVPEAASSPGTCRVQNAAVAPAWHQHLNDSCGNQRAAGCQAALQPAGTIRAAAGAAGAAAPSHAGRWKGSDKAEAEGARSVLPNPLPPDTGAGLTNIGAYTFLDQQAVQGQDGQRACGQPDPQPTTCADESAGAAGQPAQSNAAQPEECRRVRAKEARAVPQGWVGPHATAIPRGAIFHSASFPRKPGLPSHRAP